MKRLLTIFLGICLMLNFAGCSVLPSHKAEEEATTILVAKSRTNMFVDSVTGEKSEFTTTYSNDGFTKRDDGILQYHSHYEENGSRTDVISFYTSDGKYIGTRTTTPDSGNSDYLDVADTQTIEGYKKTHSEIQEFEDNTAYFADGSYTKLTVVDDLIVGEDTYDASDVLVYHYRAGSKDEAYELWINYLPEFDDYEIKIEITYNEILVETD